MTVHMLLAETDTSTRSHLATYFSHMDFFVDSVPDAVQCLDRLRASRPRVLVIDADLPWGGGDGILSLIRDGDLGRPAAVVALGRQAPADLSMRLGLHPICCVRKPAHPSSIVIRIAMQLFATERGPIPGLSAAGVAAPVS